jgi:hypothetical protein
MTYLKGSFCPSNYQTDFQEQMDLARWEGDGGAPAAHTHRRGSQLTRCDVVASSAVYRPLRVREQVQAPELY